MGARTYCIRSFRNEFYAGVREDGVQVLLVALGDGLLARFLFDSRGVLLSAEEVGGDLGNGETIVPGDGSPPLVEVAPSSIRVALFSVPQYGVGIQIRPDVFEEFLANPEVVEPEEAYRARAHQMVREWDAKGRFVLNTPGNQIWMDGDGSVWAT